MTARPRMPRRAVSRPGLSLLAVVALLLAGLGWATQAPPATTPRAAAQLRPVVPVASASAACPDPVVDARSSTEVDLAVAGQADGRASAGDSPAGEARLRGLGGRGPVAATLDHPSSTHVSATATGVPLLASASGALAPGLVASMTTRSTGDELRGLSSTACLPPGTDFWFVGSGAVIGQRGRVYLTNPEPVPAVVDLTLYGPDGVVDATSGRGVTVAAGAQEVLKLDALAPDVPALGVHVSVRQGRVSAAVRDQQVEGLTPRGADWLPAAAPPSRHLVLPGVAAGAGERHLMIVVPGDSDAIVRVRILGVDGGFVPAGLDVVEARAGRLTDLDLASYAGGRPVAIQLSADAPVTAGLLSQIGLGGEKPSELAYTAAAPVLQRSAPAVVPDLCGRAAGPTVRCALRLAAPGEAAAVEVTPLAPATGPTRRVVVPAGSQVAVAGSDLSDAASFAVVVRRLPGSAQVVAAREITEADPSGDFVTTSLVTSPRYSVRVPPVLADLSTGLRPRNGQGARRP
ncbi:MAG: hypothetical protein QOI54_1407 [Actinomycetota bacterium]|nr:hypothetical protein [Actinomycetota bacterium]